MDTKTKSQEQRIIKASDYAKTIGREEWLIESILPKNGLCEIIGASGSFKTFIILDMLFCISSGINYHGYKTVKGTVVYIAGEGAGNNLKKRLLALELHYGIHDYNFYILPMPSNIFDVNEVQLLATEIRNIAENVSVIMFDTLNRNSSGADENSSKDLAIMLQNTNKHLTPISSMVGWVHHTGLNADSANRGRGTSARYGALEVQILVTKKKPSYAVVSNTKQKDGKEFQPIVFELKPFIIHLENEENYQISTLVPFLSLGTSNDFIKSSALKSIHIQLLELLKQCIDLNGCQISFEPNLDKTISNSKMVSSKFWEESALKMIKSKGANDPKRQHEAKRKTFIRSKETLLSENIIAEHDGYVYIVKPVCKLE